MARTDPQVNIRIPVELKAALELAAQGQGRSLTAEIVLRLERSFVVDELSEAKSQVIGAYERQAQTTDGVIEALAAQLLEHLKRQQAGEDSDLEDRRPKAS